MIVRCNVGCKISDGITDASLDVESNTVVCNTCGDNLDTISSYTKLSMKTNGDILRSKNKKAFVFPCTTCSKQVEASMQSGVLVGKNCPQEQKGCKLNITKHMERAIELSEKE